MSSKYVDSSAIVQVIGNIYNNPRLFEYDDKYVFTDEDFPEKFHKLIFNVIYKLYELGANKIDLNAVNDFLSSRPKHQALFEKNNGEKYLLHVSEAASAETFDYYYQRLKKFSLLRAYDNFGLDVSFLYDPDNILDQKKKEFQEDWLDNTSIDAIALEIDDKIEEIKSLYVQNLTCDAVNAGEGIEDLIDKFKENPEVGIPLYGPLINTVTRGARLKKFYLRSAPSGAGKTRTFIADTCNIGCDKLWEDGKGWVSNGVSQPVAYFTTEQELSEVQTMMLAFVSNVNEDHILNGQYEPGEEQRVREASKIIKNSPIYVIEMPDFSLRDIEVKIKNIIREKNVRYIVHDYIHTSLKILEEISRRSGGVKLREDNILFMLSTKLKDICNQYGVFILSGTQLSGDYKTSDSPDQNLLRGAKSIADKIDVGMIWLNTTPEDLAKLDNVIRGTGFKAPNLKLSVYKNRRGKYKGVYLWCDADLGTCRVKPMFCTTWNYEMINIEDTKIIVEERSAF